MVSGIGGDYQNVVGLPVSMLLSLLEEEPGWNDLARSAVAV
ncbi:MAG: Maf family protein, partial [Thermoleophilia bacterium]|nr:Maf family protein [Thermoleophilia bacterium]